MKRLKELQKLAEVKLKGKNPAVVLKSYNNNKLFELAQDHYNKGELDLAYVAIYKCLSMLSYLTKYENAINLDRTKINKDFLTAMDLMEQLNEEIMALPVENKDAEPKDQIVNDPIVQTENNFSRSCAWLHSLLVEDAQRVLIIDTRTSQDFNYSHIQFSGININIINIPECNIQEGISAQKIGQTLELKALELYEKRKDFRYVVLLHMEQDAKPVRTLYTALSKFDKFQYENLEMLTEGYRDWCSYYVHCVTKALPNQRLEEEIRELNYLDLNDVTYDINFSFDNEYADAQPYLESATVPHFDRSKKPFLSNKYRNNIEVVNGDIEKDNNKLEIEAEMQLKQFLYQKEREIDAERINILQEEGAKIEKLKSEQAEINRQLSYDLKLQERTAREELGRMRKLKNTNSELEKNIKNIEESRKGSEPFSRRGSDIESNIQTAIHPQRVQPEVPKVDRSVKPINTATTITNPIIGVSPGLTGLKNLGNTCYMNSILQCISNNSALALYFYECCYRNDLNRKEQYRGEIAEKVAAVVRELWSGNRRAVACQPLKSAIGSIKPEYKTCEQQDSHEFLTYLMDWLHSDLKKDVPLMIKNEEETEMEKVWKDFRIKNESMIFTLFYGLQRSTVECLKCFEQSSTYEPFSNLSLIIPEGNNVTLMDCLNLYLNVELISGWRCPKCKCERQAKKTIDLCKLPYILVIHLKRFSFLDVSSKKRTTFVDFPLENLDLRCSDRVRIYELYGVSNHYGTIEGGHYTAYCKNPQYQRWYKFDDHEVLDLSPTNVTTSAAYILFYSSPDSKNINR